MKLLVMKCVHCLLILLIILVLQSCQDGSSVRNDARSGLRDLPPGSVAPPAAVGASGVVHHYICANDCAGSGGPEDGTCPVCGSQYLHNDAWHNQPSMSTPNIQTIESMDPVVTFPGEDSPTPVSLGGQNAKGVWHYTCANGCAGGAGSAVACASCGATLEHNQAYHDL